jgi:hypothetical protein
MHVTTLGLGVAGEPMFNLEPSASPIELGDAILKSLTAWRDDVPHPETFKPITQAILRRARKRSWRQFARGSSLVGVLKDGGTFRAAPYKPDVSDSFSPTGTEFVVREARPEILGSEVLGAFNSCPKRLL